jgi:hypothetical protein
MSVRIETATTISARAIQDCAPEAVLTFGSTVRRAASEIDRGPRARLDETRAGAEPLTSPVAVEGAPGTLRPSVKSAGRARAVHNKTDAREVSTYCVGTS